MCQLIKTQLNIQYNPSEQELLNRCMHNHIHGLLAYSGIKPNKMVLMTQYMVTEIIL